MPNAKITLNLEETPWHDLRDNPKLFPAMGETVKDLRFGALPNGTVEGMPTVNICFELPDGRIVLTETTMRIFCSAARAFEARYPEVMR